MKIINLPAADREFVRAVKHLDKECPEKVPDFVHAIDNAAALIADHPYIGAPAEDGARGYVMTGFPYTIYYVIKPDRIVVAAFAHHSRRRGYWRTRL